jgi:hypothetical protein
MSVAPRVFAPTDFAELCQFSGAAIDALGCPHYHSPTLSGRIVALTGTRRANARGAIYCVLVPVGASAALGNAAGLSDFELR